MIAPQRYPLTIPSPSSRVRNPRWSAASAPRSLSGQTVRAEDSPTLQAAKTITPRKSWRMNALKTNRTMRTLKALRSPMRALAPRLSYSLIVLRTIMAKTPSSTIRPVLVPTSPSWYFFRKSTTTKKNSRKTTAKDAV